MLKWYTGLRQCCWVYINSISAKLRSCCCGIANYLVPTESLALFQDLAVCKVLDILDLFSINIPDKLPDRSIFLWKLNICHNECTTARHSPKPKIFKRVPDSTSFLHSEELSIVSIPCNELWSYRSYLCGLLFKSCCCAEKEYLVNYKIDHVTVAHCASKQCIKWMLAHLVDSFGILHKVMASSKIDYFKRDHLRLKRLHHLINIHKEIKPAL